MAQAVPQLDYQLLHDLKLRFPEIPEDVVSQCLLQNNNNLDVCCLLLAQESNRYLYGEYHSPEESRLARNHMLHISLGYPSTEGAKANGGRPLVHSSSDGHIEPQRGGPGAGQRPMVFQEPHSAPATMAPSPGYSPFFVNDPGRSAGTPPPGVPYPPVPHYAMNPITVTLPQSIPSVPQALQIPTSPYSGAGGSALYVRPAPSQSPQPAPWPSPAVPVFSPSPYASPYPGKPVPQTAYHSPPPSQFPSPYSSPQHQIQQAAHAFLPISPPNVPGLPYQAQQSMSYLPHLSSKTPLKNQIEISLEGGQRAPTPAQRSGSPGISQPRGQNSLYISTNSSPSSPSRGISLTSSFHPGMYIHPVPARPLPASSPQPGNAYIKIKVSPGRTQGRPLESPTVETESLLNIVDQAEHPAAPAPILPITVLPGNISSKINNMPRRSSSGSDDYAYTQALLLHQRARMERLVKELLLERQKLEQLKADVNEMEYDALQRRFRRVNSSSFIPRPEEMTRLRGLNRQLQIDIDCTLKETDLLKIRGKFDPKAMSNFYDNIQPGPVVPPKPVKKDGVVRSVAGGRSAPQDEDFEGAQWNCESCTFLNHPALNRCEQCEMPRYT
ncbi:TGF-beta-activated kinase 1 and MAP3K7-binding protein 3 [Paramormyrops kingsleyae]|uniref:TGF-beta activated kinase 1 (MAP3K7) binding protein 3 n=1 Tax=Paramormyrops kingsleyae TaxID=1676925 RepID=A0A3B3TB30_9TELE|nr:TGF-beta-activated kinase 1 and MAP3K7-binding protein 3 [Paramormyrops kingsleyae]XP_023649501.1 TGF-beta-activated kinase 1 and MAP3K7-binding protein 3 [Paramormyrops kingsleyae]XP_023649502.1 TGF-beta-activated kinase 1 and MAP3K7-binding protein 3 [Paramormyrops kingsleyae]XP_023649503.1 TGF-beta-activated kinase 1 and MAP3K7-binding protein 3 [Paramormyrops kingsleyae]XP_023649505.1 TGF-beta-activated kinase 1 and MAP3K7-binding protein 3 [Paramormyrops kingsleyae]